MPSKQADVAESPDFHCLRHFRVRQIISLRFIAHSTARNAVVLVIAESIVFAVHSVAVTRQRAIAIMTRQASEFAELLKCQGKFFTTDCSFMLQQVKEFSERPVSKAIQPPCSRVGVSSFPLLRSLLVVFSAQSFRVYRTVAVGL
jgi:hypothetical protein